MWKSKFQGKYLKVKLKNKCLKIGSKNIWKGVPRYIKKQWIEIPTGICYEHLVKISLDLADNC